ITANPRVWVDTMMVEERGYSVAREEPLRAAAATFAAFVVVGFVPLSVFIFDTVLPSVLDQPFVWSSVLTGIAFFGVGALKSRFVSQRWWLSGSETLVMGGAAAVIAFAIGTVLENVVG
ncbi:MAG: vacuolar iron transporter family protein, partial [Actinomycetota bacterium]|nr:vacuolar iron transporter family protein [Actinomycetota bacterium]